MEQQVMLLDQKTANKIAAGEVVEKPASVVKELIENALDAGADKVEITVTEGGTAYLKVTDNGSGMSAENAGLAVLRHATSKIRCADDLLKVSTLGFRGEALPSIASVANFTLLTRREGDEFATQVRIDGGLEPEIMMAGGPVGTTVIVENLFFNVPARRKFLKTVATEGRYINEVVTKAALSRPEVSFLLINNGKTVVRTPGNGELADTVAALYGKQVAAELLPLAYTGDAVKIGGFISKPTLLKGTRQWQTVFVNMRPVNNRMVAKAIDHAYQSQIPKAGYPFAVLNITIAPGAVDVNVHPQKSEVKFSDESLVYKTVYHGLIEALTKPLTSGETDVPGRASASLQPAFPKTAFMGTQESIWKNNPGEASGKDASYWLSRGSQSVFEQAAMPLREAQAALDREETLGQLAVEKFDPLAGGVEQIWPLGQVDRLFIVAQSETSLFLIDQHAAHERILYDKLVRVQGEIPAQQLLVPLLLDALPQEVALIEENAASFAELGVEISQAGETVLRIDSLPADVKEQEAEGFVRDILKLLTEMKRISPADLRQEVMHYAACHGAIRAGELLNIRQMKALIAALFNTEHPFTCPHGRPCMIEISSEQLYKMFKRT